MFLYEEVISVDIRTASALINDDKDIKSISTAAYRLGPARTEELEKVMIEMVSLDYWDPKFQAWWPLVNTYLGSGVNSDLAVKYYTALQKKIDRLETPISGLCDFYRDAYAVLKSSTTDIFEYSYYQDIEEICNTVIYFFVEKRRNIIKSLYTQVRYNSMLEELVIKDGNSYDWFKAVRGLDLYRHCQFDSISWNRETLDKLGEAVNIWDTVFYKEFNNARNLLSDTVSAYGWYCDYVLETIKGIFTKSFRGERLNSLNANISYALPANISDRLVAWFNSNPAVYDCGYNNNEVWEVMLQLFFTKYADAGFLETAGYKALCIPPSYFTRLCDVLYDFFWVIKNGILTSTLYTRKKLNYDRGIGLSVTPEEYLDDLYSRGFPELK